MGGPIGKIGNVSLMRSLAKVLGIEGVESRAPARLKTDELIPVIGLDPGWANYEPWQLNSGAIAIPTAGAGTSQLTVDLVGIGAPAAIFSTFGRRNNGAEENVLLGAWLNITYDAAGAVLDSGKQLDLQMLRRTGPSPVDPVIVGDLNPWWIVATNILQYSWSMPFFSGIEYLNSGEAVDGSRNGLVVPPQWVNAGGALSLIVALSSGVWPANTTITVHAYGVACPKGFRPPGI